MKKRRIIFLSLIAVIVVFAALTSGVVAYMFRRTADKKNEFTPAEVSCEVIESFDKALAEKTSITVKNTGNIDAYLRLRLVTYWVDSSGAVAAKPSVMPEIQIADGWIAGSDNTYYYSSPIAPDGVTPEFLKAGTKIVLEQTDENGCRQVIDVFAEAIQSVPDNAAVDSWNVTVENGRITAAR